MKNNEKIIYAKKIAKIGELIELGAAKFGEGAKIEGSTIEVLRRKIDLYAEGLDCYRKGMEEMLNIKPPKLIMTEHGDLTKAVQELIDSSTMMIESVSITDLTYDKSLHVKGKELQELAIKRAEKASVKIIEKFT